MAQSKFPPHPSWNLSQFSKALKYSFTGNATRLNSLPAELLLRIADFLHPQDYITFAMTHYWLLHRHGIVPCMSAELVGQILFERMPRSAFTSRPLPNELLDQIMSYLDRQDMIHLVLAFYPRFAFQHYVPPLTNPMRRELYVSGVIK